MTWWDSIKRHLSVPLAVPFPDDALAPRRDPLEYLKDVSKLELRRGDILVFRTEMPLSPEQIWLLRQRLEEQIGERIAEWGVKLLIITHGCDIAVLRDEEKP